MSDYKTYYFTDYAVTVISRNISIWFKYAIIPQKTKFVENTPYSGNIIMQIAVDKPEIEMRNMKLDYQERLLPNTFYHYAANMAFKISDEGIEKGSPEFFIKRAKEYERDSGKAEEYIKSL